MSRTVASITRKRATLKSRITTLDTALSQGRIDKVNTKLRLARLTEVFKEYEVLNDELALLDPENEGLNQMDEIQDNYYAIASKIESIPDAGGSGIGTSQLNASTTATPVGNSTINNSIMGVPLGNSTIFEKRRLLKLPISDLPKFDGDYEQWLSFKNTFLAMIDSRTDVDDLNKFLYLRSSLTGPAFNKLALYSASAENYKKAWDLLVENYEKKRILIAKHYDSLIDITPSSKATTESLNKIVDDARQHMNILETLGARPSDGLVVRLLERKLPAEVRRKWEENLSFDVFPNFEQFCKFVSESAFRISSFEQAQSRDNNDSSFKRRHAGRQTTASKSRKTESGARAFVTSSFPACVQCKGSHPLYKCSTFAGLSVNQRVEFVKTKGLCKNCLRAHKGPCPSMKCKLCNKFHHTLLHFKPVAQQVTPKSNTPKTDAVEGKSTT